MMQPKRVVIKAKYIHPSRWGNGEKFLPMYTPENQDRVQSFIQFREAMSNIWTTTEPKRDLLIAQTHIGM